jgi:hypothetical protein
MRNVVFLAAAAVAITCWAAVGSAETITVYTDKTEWQNALGGQYLTEDFADTMLNAGVSYVSSESGHINPEQECYQDVLASESQNDPMTVWTFEPQIAAFGGDWTLGGPGGSGNSLHVYIDDDSLYVGAISNSFNGGFWGFVSDTAFSSVTLVGGSGTNQQHYCLDDMVYWQPEFSGVESDPVLAGAEPALMLGVAPNPTAGSTALLLRSTASLRGVEISVYDVAGREVRKLPVGDLSPGEHQVVWDGRSSDGHQVASGIYLYRAVYLGGETSSRRLVVLR